eukprot:scaffold2042_cov295-Pinguiococcus_pyrenoidosus.AAC.1
MCSIFKAFRSLREIGEPSTKAIKSRKGIEEQRSWETGGGYRGALFACLHCPSAASKGTFTSTAARESLQSLKPKIMDRRSEILKAKLRSLRRFLAIEGATAVVQLVLVAPVYNKDTEGLFWASRTDDCFIEKTEFQWYSYMYCIELVADGTRYCLEYPDEPVESETLTSAARIYTASMALASVTILLSLLEFCAVGAILYNMRQNDEPLVIAAVNLSLTSALCCAFSCVNCAVITGISAGGDAQKGSIDVFPQSGSCGGLSEETELGYGAGVHLALSFFFVIKMALMVMLSLFAAEIRQSLRPRSPAVREQDEEPLASVLLRYQSIHRYRGTARQHFPDAVVATTYAEEAPANDYHGVEVVQAFPVATPVPSALPVPSAPAETTSDA